MNDEVSESRVGSRGELFTTKEMREKLGLRPGGKVLMNVEGGKLVVEPVLDLVELLAESPAVEITLAEDEEERRRISRETEA
jgi:bifunctional DNA-binding transcriptional regulator/antitoxin component of YhaV-PrlF toxin-antitoxin module